MPRKSEIQIMTESIMETNGGKAFFNFREVSKIIGCGINTVPGLLYNEGVTVKKVGTSKRVSAYEIAQLMCTNRTVAICDG